MGGASGRGGGRGWDEGASVGVRWGAFLQLGVSRLGAASVVGQ